MEQLILKRRGHKDNRVTQREGQIKSPILKIIRTKEAPLLWNHQALFIISNLLRKGYRRLQANTYQKFHLHMM